MKNTRNFHLTATQTWEIFKCCLLVSIWYGIHGTTYSHGRRSSRWFGEHQSFAQKMTWFIHSENALGFHWNWDGFPVRIKVISKKKRVFNEIETAFLFKLRWFPTEKRGVCVCMLKKILRGQNCPKNMKLPKTLTQNCPKNIKSLKILTQNCPNNMKLPKFWRAIDTLKPSGAAPPPPTPMPTALQYRFYYYLNHRLNVNDEEC